MSIRRLTGTQWKVVDPFIFCAFHNDSYPRGNGRLGPATESDGSWSMYHGLTVPGFPQHPHCGFETLTLVIDGTIDHADSAGSYGRYGAGDLQWMTAGRGVCHSEMFPLVNTDKANPAKLFQLWLNLPAARKGADPTYVMQWAEAMPVATPSPGARVFVHAGAFTAADGTVTAPAACPPASLAADPAYDVAVWRVELASGAAVQLPEPKAAAARRTLFVFGGAATVALDGRPLPTAASASAVDVPAGVRSVTVAAAGDGGASVLVLQGAPIDEPCVTRGPFVANSTTGIAAAYASYSRGEYGRWTYDSDGPTFGGADVPRFAVLRGKREDPPARHAA